MTTPKKPHSPASTQPAPLSAAASSAPASHRAQAAQGWQSSPMPLPEVPRPLPAPRDPLASGDPGAVGGWGTPVLVLASVALAAGTALTLVSQLGMSGWWAAPLSAAVGVLMAAWPMWTLGLRKPVPEPLSPPPAESGPATQPMSLPGVGVPRGMFNELAAREWARARRHGSGAALLIVEIDRHARLVQSRGQGAAEAVLNELLAQTGPTLRGADLLTRWSDSEMAVFLAPADATGALDVAERIRERAEQMEILLPASGQQAAQRLRVTVSVGVSQLRPAHLNLQALVDDALEAVTASRQSGGNCVRAAPVEQGSLRSPGNWRDGHPSRP